VVIALEIKLRVPVAGIPISTRSHFIDQKKLVPLTVYHQNIVGLRRKELALLSQLYPILPHVLFFRTTEELLDRKVAAPV
jgi:hypothetical protein